MQYCTWLRCFILFFCILISGCQDSVSLNTGLTEQEANNIIAELASNDINASKQTNKEGISVLVDKDDMPRAVRILDAAGLPKKQRTNMGEVFHKDGIISTPLEERARYIYALSQELESTISDIDGVVVARVEVVLPERIAPGEPIEPASASVFIKYKPELDPDVIRPRIRRLVQSSIMGLDDSKKLSIIFVPAKAISKKPEIVPFGPFLINKVDAPFWFWTLSAAALVVVLLIITAVVIFVPSVRKFVLKVLSMIKKRPDDSK